MKNIFLIVIIILSSIYTISYAKYEFKKNRKISATASAILVIAMVVIFIIRVSI